MPVKKNSQMLIYMHINEYPAQTRSTLYYTLRDVKKGLSKDLRCQKNIC